MQTLIVGIGALGGTIAARGISAGLPVRLAARNTDSAAALRRSGLRVTGIGGEVRADAIDGDQQRALSSFVKVAPPEPAVTKQSRNLENCSGRRRRKAGLVAGGPSLRSQSQKAQLTEKRHRRARRLRQQHRRQPFRRHAQQALSVALNQSPFLNVLPDNKVGAMLKLMTRPSDAKLTPELARELCQRGRQQGLHRRLDPQHGQRIRAGTESRELPEWRPAGARAGAGSGQSGRAGCRGRGQAAKLRGELGESLVTVRSFDCPAGRGHYAFAGSLKAYTLGQAAGREKGPAAALPHNQRAIQLDPNFASGYEAVGATYFSLSELGRASEYFNKAFELREHASEREKLAITATYYQIVTGELEKAEQTYQEWVESYPRDYRAHLLPGQRVPTTRAV